MRTTSLICLTGLTICFLFSIGTGQTFAWLTSETHTTGTITNATAHDLLQLTAEQTSCGEDDMMEITMTNTGDVTIPIETDFYTGEIASDTSITKEIPEPTDQSQTIDVHVSGFQGFIEDTFHVDIAKHCP